MPTLLQLRDRCKEETDSVGQSFISDSEWDKYINSSYREAYGLLTQKYGSDYFVKATPQTITTDGLNQFFALATDFFKLLGVDLLISGSQYVSLRPFAYGDRNKFSGLNSSTPQAGQTVLVRYVPRLTALAVDADATVDAFDINGWDELIVADVGIKATAKGETDSSVFMARKEGLIKRIESEAANRDAGSPATIVDVIGRRGRGMQYRLSGSNLWLIGAAQPLMWDYGEQSGPGWDF